MSDFNNTVTLTSSKNYICVNETDAYRIVSGRVLVFIVPLKKWGEGRKSYIYEASPGEMIPSFCFRDRDAVNWRFCLTAVENAEIEIVDYGTTKILKDKFAEKTGLPNYKHEGYNSGLVEKYKANILKEDILIRRNKNLKSSTFSDTLELIASSFKKKQIKVETESSGNNLYDCVSIICAKQSIPIAPYEKVKEACGESFGIADIARISHFSYRRITLGSDWQKEDSGPFVVFMQDDSPLACIPGKLKVSGKMSYVLYNPDNKEVVPVTGSVADGISPRAYMLYRPIPAKKLGVKDLFSFCKSSVLTSDVIIFLMLVLITAVIGLLIPVVNQKLFDVFIPMAKTEILTNILLLLLSFMLANAMISVVKNLYNFRIVSRINYDINNAVFDRVFSLPESFFRKYESADLTKRVMSAGSLVGSVTSAIINGSIALIFMTVYFIKMVSYGRSLTAIGVSMIVIYGIIFYFINKFSVKYSEEAAKLDSEAGSKLFQYISGISKIRIAGVEDRAIYEYLKPFIRLREKNSRAGKIALINGAISTLASTAFTVIFYIVVSRENNRLQIGEFTAFISMFGVFEGYALEIVSETVSLRAAKPAYERFKPIMLEKPEYDEGCELPGDISGEIEIKNISFSYSEDEPDVLTNIDFTVNPGDYIGIVGPSGSGKSTLMKILLGFEKPTSGKIYYDNKDIEKLDKRELRKKMGVVLQNGKLISGSIFDNITITAPEATADDVNKVIQAVGLKDDIEKMPMGIHTMLNEESNTISGGQMQRILIARAIISSPKILIFDEATSALDNITQSMVSETLDKMDVTRIVIAHRLSTIMQCNRIIVLDKGKIAEEGAYDELMQKRGIFYELAGRQIS